MYKIKAVFGQISAKNRPVTANDFEHFSPGFRYYLGKRMAFAAFPTIFNQFNVYFGRMERKQKKVVDAEHPIFEKGRTAQPAGLFAVFSVIGIAVLFLTIMVMFALASPSGYLSGQHFPKLFFFSTPVILLCSYTIEKTKRAFRTDNSDALLKWQTWTLALSLMFCAMQFFGWKQLWETGITMTAVNAGKNPVSSNGGAYLYVLSGLHVAHLLGGLCFLLAAMVRLINNREDMVKAVVYFSDKQEGAKISALALYWHFLGALWCVMFLFFLWFFV